MLIKGQAKELHRGQNNDSRPLFLLEIFYVGLDGGLYHDWQTRVSGPWNGPAILPGTAAQVGVTRNNDGRLEIVSIGTDNILYHNWQRTPSGPWMGQNSLGGTAKQVVMARNKDGCLEIFYVGRKRVGSALSQPSEQKSTRSYESSCFRGFTSIELASFRRNTSVETEQVGSHYFTSQRSACGGGDAGGMGL